MITPPDKPLRAYPENPILLLFISQVSPPQWRQRSVRERSPVPWENTVVSVGWGEETPPVVLWGGWGVEGVRGPPTAHEAPSGQAGVQKKIRGTRWFESWQCVETFVEMLSIFMRWMLIFISWMLIDIWGIFIRLVLETVTLFGQFNFPFATNFCVYIRLFLQKNLLNLPSIQKEPMNINRCKR